MFCSAALPIVPGLIRTPSTSTRLWFDSLPRMKREVCCPGPPVRAISRPLCRRNASAMSAAGSRSSSSLGMTSTEASASLVGIAVRVAVTSTGSMVSPSASPGDNNSAGRMAAMRGGRFRMTDIVPRTPAGRCNHDRVAKEGMDARRNALRAHRPPRLGTCDRPVSGLSAGLAAFPRRLPAGPRAGSGLQVDACVTRFCTDYRCGGSAGFAIARSPASRLTRADPGHLSCGAM